jgi:hypothetical protein
LLRTASTEFDVLVTADKNLQYQQNIPKFNIGVVVLALRDVRLPSLRSRLVEIEAAIERNFGGVTITKSRLDLGFFLQRREQNGRITRIEPLSPTKVANHVDLRSPSDVDAELVAWLAEAYEIGRAVRAV